MASDSVRVRSTRYRGGIPGQGRRNEAKGTLHLGSRGLYVSKAVVLGATVCAARYGKVDRGNISSIEVGPGATQDQASVTVHLNDGSVGLYEVRGASPQEVHRLLEPAAADLGILLALAATTG
jgi:hypothetical protein